MKLTNLVFLTFAITLSLQSLIIAKSYSYTSKINQDFPVTYQTKKTNPGATVKAEKQTQAAMELLSKPGEEAKKILKGLATGLAKVFNNVSEKEFKSTSINRTIKGGVYDKKLPADQKAALARLQTETGKAVDNAFLVGMCGDLGEQVVEQSLLEDGDSKKFIIADFVKSGFKKERLESWGKSVKSKRGGNAIAPAKKQERYLIKEGDKIDGEIAANGGKKPAKPDDKVPIKVEPARVGVFEVPDVVKSGLPKAKWPYQAVPTTFMKNCNEPWAGHYSGSMGEILFMIDLMTGVENPAENGRESPNRKCKAALASAFLISIGYHTAMEVKPMVEVYLDKSKTAADFANNKRVDAKNGRKCDETSTEYMTKLMAECSANGGSGSNDKSSDNAGKKDSGKKDNVKGKRGLRLEDSEIDDDD